VREHGIPFLRDALASKQLFERLRAELANPAVRHALATVLVREGNRLLEEYKPKYTANPKSPIGEMKSPLKDILDKSTSRDRLRELMLTENGREVLREAVSQRGGEFLIVGYMFNTPGGLRLTSRLLLSEEGRKTAAAILGAACLTSPDPLVVKKLPPYKPTEFGRNLSGMLSSDGGVAQLRAMLKDKKQREALVMQFKANEAEARGVLRDAVSTEGGRARMVALMTSEEGRAFLKGLGEKGLGKTIGGDDLWLLEGGRRLVRELLGSKEGREAVWGLVSGFSIGSSLLKTLPLEREIRGHPG